MATPKAQALLRKLVLHLYEQLLLNWHAESFDDIVITQFIRPEAVGCDMEIDDQDHRQSS